MSSEWARATWSSAVSVRSGASPWLTRLSFVACRNACSARVGWIAARATGTNVAHEPIASSFRAQALTRADIGPKGRAGREQSCGKHREQEQSEARERERLQDLGLSQRDGDRAHACGTVRRALLEDSLAEDVLL